MTGFKAGFEFSLLLLLLLTAVALYPQDVHIVQRGDTLYSIATRNQTTVEEIMRLNNMSSTTLSIGQRLIVPRGTPPSSNPAVSSNAGRRAIYHTVQAGDTLFNIAQRYDTSEANIREWNNLADSVLRIDRRLIVGYESTYPADTSGLPPPLLPSQTPTFPSGRNPPIGSRERPLYHIVERGEILGDISERYDIDILDLVAFNDLFGTAIYEGQRIYLEAGHLDNADDEEVVEERVIIPDNIFAPSNPNESRMIVPNARTHIVERGETLYRISVTYGISVENLRLWNGLNSNTIRVGQTIFLHNPADDPELFAINTGSIARSSGQPIKPLNNTIVISEFGMRRGRMHKGIDFTGSAGDPIYAVLDGVVAFSGVQRGFGNVVILEHGDGIMTLYAHNQTNLVRKDEVVKQGQVIARVGRTGNARGNHLHFEYRLRGVARNPRELLGRVL